MHQQGTTGGINFPGLVLYLIIENGNFNVFAGHGTIPVDHCIFQSIILLWLLLSDKKPTENITQNPIIGDLAHKLDDLKDVNGNETCFFSFMLSITS